jgi:hypothetical protein
MNAVSPILVTLLGIVILGNALDKAKNPLGILTIPLLSVMLVRPVQPEKDCIPMLVTVDGIVMLVNPVYINA